MQQRNQTENINNNDNRLFRITKTNLDGDEEEKISLIAGDNDDTRLTNKDKLQNSKDDASAACNDYLKALGFVAIAHSWIKVLEACFEDYNNNKKFYDDKIQTAKFYFKRVLPRAESHFKVATSGSDYIMNFKFN